MEEDQFVYVIVENTIDGTDRRFDVGPWSALWSPGISIGSRPDCTVVIDSDAVSPMHARVRGLGHHLFVEVVEGAIEFHRREFVTGQKTRINGLGAPVGDIGIGPFRIHITLDKPRTREDPRPWWKFW